MIQMINALKDLTDFLKHLCGSFKPANKPYKSDCTSEFRQGTEIVNISYVEFGKIIDFVNKHQSQLLEDFIITIETHPGEIGTTVIVKVRDWIGTPTLAEENVTDYSNW